MWHNERMAIRNICVLGGSGFVGTQLCARLASEGYQIKVLTRSAARSRHLLVLPTLSLVEADVHDGAVLAREFTGCDAVINLVGTLNGGRRGRNFRKVHVALAEKIVKACRTAGVHRLLEMSALGADAQDGPSYYLRSRGEAENVIRGAAGDWLRYTFYRPSVIFGPEDSFINRFAALIKLTPGIFPLPGAETRFAPVYVGDVVEAFLRGLTDRATYNQGYELCGPGVYSLREIVAYIARLLGRRCLIIGLPHPLAVMQAAVLELVPGKPLTLDNLRSMKVDSVCKDDGCGRLSIAPSRMESIVPRYVGRRRISRDRYEDFRRNAR